jgi:hypothetical protein
VTSKLYIKRGGRDSTETEVTALTGRKGVPFFDGQQSTISMGRRFADGEASDGQFLFVDPEAEVTSGIYRFSPHALVTWTEDASGDELWLARSRIAQSESGRRGPFIGGDEVEWLVTANDNNIDLRGQAFTEVWERPEETDIDRILALNAYCLDAENSTAPHFRYSCKIRIDRTHLLNDDVEYSMPAKVYPPGTQPQEVLQDCADSAGKLYGVVIHHTDSSSHDCLLYVNELDNSTFRCEAKISDHLANWDPDDPTEPVFEPIWDMGKATITDSDGVISGLVSIWGSDPEDPDIVIVHNDADETPYEYWWDSYFDSDSKTEDQARDRANAILEFRRPQRKTHRVSVQVHASQIELLCAGMMIQIKSTAAIGGPDKDTYVWRRIAELIWEPMPNGDYWAHMNLDKAVRKRGESRGRRPGPKPPGSPGKIGGVCSGTSNPTLSSGAASGFWDWKACDLDVSTQWSTNSFPVNAQWWARDLGSATQVNSVAIDQTGNAAGNTATSVTVWATSDGAKWTGLGYPHDFNATGWNNVGSLAGLSSSDSGRVDITGGTYRYWAFDATAGGGNGWAVSEFALYSGGDTSTDVDGTGTGSTGDNCDTWACVDHHHAHANITSGGPYHMAEDVTVDPFGTIAATDVQAALEEIVSEASAGVTDHGALTGLGDDDHPQYVDDAELAAELLALQAANVEEIADTSTATTEEVGDKVNELIVALVASGLMAAPTGDNYNTVVLADSPVHYWRLNEASGVLEDAISTNDITITGAVGYHAAGATGDSDYAVTFDGSDYGTIGYGSIPVGTNAFSWECLYKGTSTSKQCIVSYGTGGTRASVFLNLNDGGNPRLGLAAWGDDQNATATGLLDGNWHHIVWTHAATSAVVKIYLDGSLLATLTYGGNLNTGTAATPRVGTDHNSISSDRLNGSLDELAVYDVELSSTQVSDHFDAIGNP